MAIPYTDNPTNEYYANFLNTRTVSSRRKTRELPQGI